MRRRALSSVAALLLPASQPLPSKAAGAEASTHPNAMPSRSCCWIQLLAQAGVPWMLLSAGAARERDQGQPEANPASHSRPAAHGSQAPVFMKRMISHEHMTPTASSTQAGQAARYVSHTSLRGTEGRRGLSDRASTACAMAQRSTAQLAGGPQPARQQAGGTSGPVARQMSGGRCPQIPPVSLQVAGCKALRLVSFACKAAARRATPAQAACARAGTHMQQSACTWRRP